MRDARDEMLNLQHLPSPEQPILHFPNLVIDEPRLLGEFAQFDHPRILWPILHLVPGHEQQLIDINHTQVSAA